MRNIAIALIIITGFFVYSNSLHNKFVWDDQIYIEQNIYINNWSKIPSVFKADIAAGGGEKFNYYRPLQMLTYMIDYSLWGLNVVGYHLTNTILHILVALGIFWLVVILYSDTLIAFLTAIFFVAHPIHTEAVTYIAGRADSLAALFFLLSFIFYLKYLRFKRRGMYVLVLLSYICALLSRENSLVLPLLLLLYHYVFKKKIRMPQFLCIIGISFVFMVLRTLVLGSLKANVVYVGILPQRIPGVFAALTNYLRLLFWPFDLHHEYGQKFFHISEPKAIIGILILSALLIYVFRNRRRRGITFFSISWFFITLLPAANIYPLLYYMAEHWLYLPSVGFFIILAKGLSALYRRKDFRIPAVVFLFVLLFFYAYLTVKQNTYWKDPLTFYERTLKYSPDSARTLLSLGDLYSNIGKKEEAIALLKKAIEINPVHPYPYNNLGNIYLSMGEMEAAIEAYQKAIDVDPSYAGAYNNLGNVYGEIGMKDQALISYQKAIALNPNLVQAYNNLGLLYVGLGNYKEAIGLYEKALEISPNFAMVHNNLAWAYYYNKQYDLAIQHCYQAIELGHKDPKLLGLLKPLR